MLFNTRKKQLIKELTTSSGTATTLLIMQELRAKGWLEGGVLNKANLNDLHARRMDFSKAQMREVRLIDADLHGANLSGADLTKADLTGANLDECNLGMANLDGANMENVQLIGALITEKQFFQVDMLLGATMPDGSRYDGRYRLVGDLYHAERERIDFSKPDRAAAWYGVDERVYEEGQEWIKEHLDDIKKDIYHEAHIEAQEIAQRVREAATNEEALEAFKDMRYGGWLKNAGAHGIDLSGAKLEGVDLTEASLRGANLSGADLRRATLIEADLSHANLEGALMAKANAYDCLLEGANLKGVDIKTIISLDLIEINLSGANLSGADLRDLSFEDADLSGADLSGADLRGVNLRGAFLDDANFTDAQVVDIQLVRATMLSRMTMPDTTIYNGRFDLEADLDAAEEHGIDIENDDQIAHWYGIEAAEYLAGVRWAEENLEQLMEEAGINREG